MIWRPFTHLGAQLSGLVALHEAFEDSAKRVRCRGLDDAAIGAEGHGGEAGERGLPVCIEDATAERGAVDLGRGETLPGRLSDASRFCGLLAGPLLPGTEPAASAGVAASAMPIINRAAIE